MKKDKLPAFRPTEVFLLRNRLAMIGGQFLDSVLDSASFQKLAELVFQALPVVPPFEALRESLQHLAGGVFRLPQWRETAWRLAGNLPALMAGKAVGPWVSQHAKEWMPMKIVEVHRRRKFDGSPCLGVSFQVLAGSACPEMVRKLWSYKQAKYHRQAFGFSRFQKPAQLIRKNGQVRVRRYPYTDPMELVGLQVWGLFDPASCLKGKPSFSELRGSSSFVKHNREILAARMKLLPPCPLELTKPCWMCPAGYDKCKAACRPRTLVRGECSGCKKPAWLDPGGNKAGLCEACVFQSYDKKGAG